MESLEEFLKNVMVLRKQAKKGRVQTAEGTASESLDVQRVNTWSALARVEGWKGHLPCQIEGTRNRLGRGVQHLWAQLENWVPS